MPLPLIAAGLSLVGGVGKIIQGFRQRKAAKKLQKSNYIPPAMTESINRLKAGALSAMLPGYGRAVEHIQANTANSIRAAGSGSISDKLATAQGVNVAQNDAVVDLEAKGAQHQLMQEDRLNQGLASKASVEMGNEQQFRQTKQQLLNSGSQNISGGLSDMATVGTTAMALGGAGGANKLLAMDDAMFKNAVDKGQIKFDDYPGSKRRKMIEKYNIG